MFSVASHRSWTVSWCDLSPGEEDSGIILCLVPALGGGGAGSPVFIER